MYSKIILLKTSGLSQGFNDLQEAENAAVAGDCVVVYPGTYDLGAGQLVMKNGVNKKFMPGVTITSTHAQATVWDNNAAVIQIWEGRPNVVNTGSGVAMLFEHANTEIDFSPRLENKVVLNFYTDISVLYVNPIKNTTDVTFGDEIEIVDGVVTVPANFGALGTPKIIGFANGYDLKVLFTNSGGNPIAAGYVGFGANENGIGISFYNLSFVQTNPPDFTTFQIELIW
jgi:hypothetical protein